MGDRAQMPLEQGEETVVHRLSHRVPPQEAVRDGPGGPQMTLLLAGTLPEMAQSAGKKEEEKLIIMVFRLVVFTTKGW